MNKVLNVVILGGKGRSTNIMYHALKDEVNIVTIVIEQPVPKKVFFKKRIKHFGYLKVFGQILFMVVGKVLTRSSFKRYEDIKEKFELNENEILGPGVVRVESVNSDSIIELLQSIKPDVVVVNGTRIIQERILTAVNVPFINTHVGITPKYRGVHGAYWALVNNDKENCGVTVHLVDTGVDTGGVLYQARITPEKIDCFYTYPLLQIAEAIPLMKRALKDIAQGRLREKDVDMPSMIWSHPTLLEYIIYYFTKGVR